MTELLNYVGNTPIIKIENIFNPDRSGVYVKLEEFNPGGSIKSRPGVHMVLDAQEKKLLTKDKIILEPTGGNTGLGITIAAIALGYKVNLVIPDNFSKEKIKNLESYGAKIILSDHNTGPGSHVRLAREILNSDNNYISLDQFSNPANPLSHYLTTGPEIINQLKVRKVDAFVAGIGTGGTLMGVGRYLKGISSDTKVIGVQPSGCDFKNNIFIPYKIEAIAVGFIPPIVNFSLIDHMINVDFNEVMELRSWLSKNKGIFVGVSSGANILASLKEAKKYKKGKIIVTVAPDSGRSYIGYE
ncbi:cysteine synthase family protein [Alcaligenes faecalis]|nr:cysteine synthase family protein [Alcaligenes faecalis]